jgi:hypothetical protein
MNKKEIPVECYSRVVGYFRPVKQWNNGKQEEFSQRKILKPKPIYKKNIDKKNEKYSM